MTYRGKFFVVILSTVITFYAFFGVILGWFSAEAQQPINDPGAQIRIFESVLQHIQNDYVDEPDLEKVRAGALRGLAYGLDPYSSYLTADQVEKFKSNASDRKVGIGAEFSQVSSYLYVISVVKDGPADKAGLKGGDVVEYIDAKASRDISLYDAEQMILGDAGSKVKLRILRSRAKPLSIEVTRGKFQDPQAITDVKEGSIGVVKVFSLQKGQGNAIREKITELKDKGVNKIVIDLRNVAGGSIDEAILVSNAFIKDGDLAKVIGRGDKVVKAYSAEPGKQIFEGEVATLINVGTAGAAEVIASSMIDRKRGEVIGERSYGAGTEQELFTLRGGDGFLLTTSKWASSKGVAFLANKRSEAGVKPSIEVKHSNTPEPLEVEDLVDPKKEDEQNPTPTPDKNPKVEKKHQEDIQMKKAIEVLKGKAKAAGA